MSASGGNSDPKPSEKAADSAAPAGGNAVDGLTPPTMKYAADERTQIGPAPSGANIAKPPSTTGSRGPSSATITGDLTGAPHTFATSVGAQDLSGERLLRDAPRLESGGHQCPSLNGIPLLAKIGQGGMGAVYYGVHPRLQSEVAVKVLPFHLAEQDPGMIKRFFREAQIAAMVRSPHLVNVMDVNEESGLFFLVMEFVPGKTAGQYLKMVLEGGQAGIPELEVLDICIAATIGLQAAHNNNIVHRDLKPENIMVPYLSRNSANQFDLKRSKLMDLGLARNEESNQSLTGVQAAMGTPGYMAPEQALDAKTADKRSDVFGMGATMYALLTGKPPFRGEAIMKVLMATMHEPHEPVIKVRPEITQTFSDIVDKCLDKKQDNRFSDATQLLRALRHCRKAIAPASDEDEDDGGADVGVVPGMSVARQPAAGGGGQKTIIAGTGQPTLVGGEALPKSKTGLYVASAAAAVILLGGIGFAMRNKDTNTGKVVSGTATSTGTGTDTSKIEPPKITMSAKVLDAQKTMHANDIRLAEDSAKAGDLETAQSFLMTAQSLPIKNTSDTEVVKALDKEEKRIQGLIEAAGKTQKFNEKLQLVDNYIKKEDLASAKKELTAANEFAIEDAALKTLTEKQTLLTFLQSAELKRKAFVDILKKSADVLKDPKNVNDETMKALMEAQSKVPPEADLVKLRRDAPFLVPPVDEFTALQKKFAAILDDRQKNEHYDKLLKQAGETTDLDKKASLLQEAIDLGLDRNEAKTAKVAVDSKLGEEIVRKREAARKAELKKEFDAAFTEAKALNDKQDYDNALVSVRRALAKLPDDPLAKKLETDLNAAILDKKSHVQFNNLIQIASGALDDGDTATAEKNVAEARKIFAKDAQLDKLDKAIADTKDRQKRKAEYDKYAANARKAIGENDVAKAQEFFDKALAIDPRTPTLDGVRQFLIQKKAEMAAAQEKADNYKKYMDEASKLEAGVTGKPLEAQVADLRKALDSYTSAKAFAPDSDKSAADKLAVVKTKLDTANTAWEKEKALALQKAKFEAMKKDFDGKLADVLKQNTGKPADAITALNAMKTDMSDKDFFKAELAKIDGQVADLNKAIAAQAETQYKQVLQQVKDKLTAKDLSGALTALRGVPPSFAGQQDVKDLNTALGTIQGIGNDIQTLVTKSNNRYTQLSNAIRTDKGDAQKARYSKSVGAIQALYGDALAKLVQNNLKDANVTSQLRRDKEMLADDIGNALDNLDTISRERVAPPPRVDPPPRYDPPPKKSSGGSVGEQDVDN